MREVVSSKAQGIISFIGDPWEGLRENYPDDVKSIPLVTNWPLEKSLFDQVIVDREWGRLSGG